jgi:hypothetical protein
MTGAPALHLCPALPNDAKPGHARPLTAMRYAGALAVLDGR